jgi:phosphoribosyl 1,2-cyclic phosphodiesterase
MEYAVAAARRAGVKRLALFHHDPDRGDEELDRLAEIYCQKKGEAAPDIFFAKEGMVIEL